MSRDLPEGTVTFLFSDIENSTDLLERHGAALETTLARHHRLFEELVHSNGGVIFETVGDAVYAAFQRPADAVRAAFDAHRALAAEDWSLIERLAVRVAVHSGQVERRGDHYFGAALFRAARLQAIGYGEQTLLSAVTARLAGDDLPEGASLRHLGSHRLKDLGEPEQVYQLVDPELRHDFPPLRGLDARLHNLPVQLSSFVGREAELAELTELLEEHRLTTLLGPGGVGKTRLALQVGAERLERHDDGVFLIDLAPVRDPELVPSVIASTLGLREQPGIPIRQTLYQHLAGRRHLLILDNLEQLLPAVARGVAQLVAAAPQTTVLVTSRAPLLVRGEREYRVPPLAAGRPDGLDAQPPAAVTLFLERARSIHPDLALDAETGPLIKKICERLDGLPLAIELAAARLRLFSLTALHERLADRLPTLIGGARDLPERQRTLRATVAWSDELLSENERRLFARLSVFAGGFSVDSAEAVAGPSLSGDVMDALNGLVEHSLVRQVGGLVGEPRYAMLETIREYAEQRLAETGEEEATRSLHLAYFRDFAERAYDERRVSASSQIPLLNAEHDNIRAALDWARASDPAAEAQLAGAVSHDWYTRGYVGEACERLTGALSRYEARDGIRARALTQLGYTLWRVDHQTALSHLEEAAALWAAIGDARGEAFAVQRIGYLFTASGDFEASRATFERSLALFRAAGAAEIETAAAKAGFCQLLIAEGQVGEAQSLAEELYELAVQHDSDGVRQSSLHHLADCPLVGGHYVEAEKRYLRALRHAQTWQMTTQAANELLGVAMSLAGQKQYRRALYLAGAAYAKIASLGLNTNYMAWWAALQDRHIGAARAGLDSAEAEDVERAGRLTPFEVVVEEVLESEKAAG